MGRRAAAIVLVIAAAGAAGALAWHSRRPGKHAEALLEAMNREDWREAVDHLSWSGIPETASREGINNRAAWGPLWQLSQEFPSRFSQSPPDLEYAVTGRDGTIRLFRFEFVDDGRINQVRVGGRQAFAWETPASPALPAEKPDVEK